MSFPILPDNPANLTEEEQKTFTALKEFQLEYDKLNAREKITKDEYMVFHQKAMNLILSDKGVAKALRPDIEKKADALCEKAEGCKKESTGGSRRKTRRKTRRGGKRRIYRHLAVKAFLKKTKRRRKRKKSKKKKKRKQRTKRRR